MASLRVQAGSTTDRNACPGLFGSGLVTDGRGEPLGPGGPEVTKALLDRAGFVAGNRVIDVGCGQGRGVGLMAGRGIRAIGIDADPGPLQIARRRVPDASFMLAGGDTLPLPDGAMDGVLSECVLSVMPDREKTLAEWHRVLRTGGRLAISDVYARHPDRSRETTIGPGAGILSARRLRGLIADAGFTVTHFEDRSDLLRAWVGRFIFQYGSLDALWGDAGTAKSMRGLAPGYCTVIAIKPVRRGSMEL